MNIYEKIYEDFIDYSEIISKEEFIGSLEKLGIDELINFYDFRPVEINEYVIIEIASYYYNVDILEINFDENKIVIDDNSYFDLKEIIDNLKTLKHKCSEFDIENGNGDSIDEIINKYKIELKEEEKNSEKLSIKNQIIQQLENCDLNILEQISKML